MQNYHFFIKQNNNRRGKAISHTHRSTKVADYFALVTQTQETTQYQQVAQQSQQTAQQFNNLYINFY